jgi:hypothetical protein
MTTYSIYELASGRIVSHFIGPASQLKINVPPEHGAVEGCFDPLGQRIDVGGALRREDDAAESPTIVDYQPAAPDPDHVWDAVRKRWIKSEAAIARDAQILMCRERIEGLNTSCIPLMREAMLGEPAAMGQLLELDQQIRASKAELQALFNPLPDSSQ